ncbi:phage head-tail joining protein [Pontibaca methylaminivorans]|uniref:GpW protein n=1 Tax=Pontibaca methylaminivorans TaxID=515897 RepID=A0A1R3WZG1_9RHOB|nr:hypothetical protein [Pontibaca methylaminivorans]SIT83531.1 hypothetical protein SAMN05421849_1925 [Pontibaca methylaminivorans]
MALGTEDMVELRDELIRARARGVRVTMYEGRRVEYANDAEMAAAIADLERRIRSASTPRPATVMFSSSKGL